MASTERKTVHNDATLSTVTKLDSLDLVGVYYFFAYPRAHRECNAAQWYMDMVTLKIRRREVPAPGGGRY